MSQALLCGVIEGFYGRPWSPSQRFELFDHMQRWGLNCYMYGPKDDIKLRARWRELYSPQECQGLRDLISACHERELHFIYAIAPGLDMRYAEPNDMRALTQKIDQLMDLGLRHVTLLFDDIPHHMHDEDQARFGSVARAQSHVANELFAHVKRRYPKGRFLFCPTDYCARMANSDVTHSSYLRELGERLHGEIEIFWTGDEIVSASITPDAIKDLQAVLGRKPIIWDNVHANDYDIRRVYLGPYKDRPAELLQEVTGILSNPNCEYEANFIPLYTLAQYVREKHDYQPREAYHQALDAWLEHFQIEGGDPITRAELELLCDIFYLPFEQGEAAKHVLRTAERALQHGADIPSSDLKRITSFHHAVRQLFEKLTELSDRDLLYALYDYVWEIRTETELLAEYVTWLASKPAPEARFSKPDRIPNTYRGGLAAKIQALLPLDERGRVTPEPRNG